MSELMHYGRKGMKWYQHIFGDQDSRAKYSKGSDSAPKKEKVGDLSDAELQKRINRLRMESEYKKLLSEKKGSISKGESFLKKILKRAGEEFATNFAKGYGQKLGEYVVQNKRLDEDDRRREAARIRKEREQAKAARAKAREEKKSGKK